MDIFNFIVTVVLVTASGALAPGPLFFATLSHGAKSGVKSGLIFSVAHTVVEFSLIMVFAFGLLTIASEPIVQLVIGIMGGIVLIGFGLLQIYKTISIKYEEEKPIKTSYRHLFFIGVLFTGFNPYFIVWWLTVGAELILISLAFASILGVIFMYICHVWMDYVWLMVVAHISKKGVDVVGLKGYRIIIGLFGIVLIYFGISFITNALDVKFLL
jgi:threonine/homoserine/homoserine lactone efflux protein